MGPTTGPRAEGTKPGPHSVTLCADLPDRGCRGWLQKHRMGRGLGGRSLDLEGGVGGLTGCVCKTSSTVCPKGQILLYANYTLTGNISLKEVIKTIPNKIVPLRGT